MRFSELSHEGGFRGMIRRFTSPEASLLCLLGQLNSQIKDVIEMSIISLTF